MTIPKHDDIRAPALALLLERGQLRLAEFEAPLAARFGKEYINMMTLLAAAVKCAALFTNTVDGSTK